MAVKITNEAIDRLHNGLNEVQEYLPNATLAEILETLSFTSIAKTIADQIEFNREQK